MKTASSISAAAIIALAAGFAGAQDGGGAKRGAERDVRTDVPEVPEVDVESQPHSIFTGGIGLLALPGAEVCPSTTADCEPGETSIAFNLLIIGRIDAWGFGGSASYGLGLRPSEAGGSDIPGLEREHSRSYFLVEGVFRRYMPPLGSWNWWVGATGGVVVIDDEWSTLADREPYADTAFVGPRSVSLATEGAAIGVAIGGHVRFWDIVVFGTHFRYANWILPWEREQTPVGDLASFAGRIDVLDVGVTAGFLLPI